ncbi:hypothetical protein M405DRAFT_863430 [Rhizopogon salebrosus TDB-379]|nr:hypothetical protein M405DRAFT_863430 [Rhizopogon salebrosus TDB-379]
MIGRANEELSLPISSIDRTNLVTALPPFLSASQLLLTPVVAFLSPLSLPPSILHPWSSLFFYTQRPAHYQALLHTQSIHLSFLHRIFDHPFEAMLDPQLLLNSWELLVGEGER